jgi:hypothetical protein
MELKVRSEPVILHQAGDISAPTAPNLERRTYAIRHA